MSEPWWKDARFIIPSILIPVLLALIGLLPSIWPHPIASKLVVSASVTDPRRSKPGAFDRRMIKDFSASGISQSELGQRIAAALIEELLPGLAPDGRPSRSITATIQLDANGTLSVDGGEGRVGLHLSRFTALHDLHSFLEADNPTMTAQRVLVEPNLPPSEAEIPVPERKLRAGVYRIVLTAPGYRDHSTYVQLTEAGELVTLDTLDGEVVALHFPLTVQLRPQPSAPLKIAIRPCRSIDPVSGEPRFAGIDQTIREELEHGLHRAGGSPVLVNEDRAVGFDLNLSKGMPPSPEVTSADFLIHDCRCEWRLE